MTGKISDLKVRFGVSLAFGLIASFLIYYSQMPFGGLLIATALAALAAVGIWEYAQLARAKGLTVSTRGLLVVAIIQLFSFYVSEHLADFVDLPLWTLSLSLVFFFLLHFRSATNALSCVAIEFLGICYLVVPLSFMMGILFPSLLSAQEGRLWLLYLILVTKITDIAAYFVGRLWGKHELAPLLSPKKTVEGSIAGLLFAVGMSSLFSIMGESLSRGAFQLPLGEAIWLGLLIGIFGQVGDLAESLLKRDAAVKDSNKIPGIGGILDMVDSLLFTAPVVYFYLRTH